MPEGEWEIEEAINQEYETDRRTEFVFIYPDERVLLGDGLYPMVVAGWDVEK